MRAVVVLLEISMVIMTYAQKNCLKEKQGESYYIYNASVEINVLYCFNDVGDEFECERFHRAKEVVAPANDVSNYCPPRSASNNNGLRLRRVFCELPAQVNLLKNTVTLNGNICRFNRKHCTDRTVSRVAFWTYNSVCRYSLQSYKGQFDVWSVANGTKLIENDRVSVILKEKRQFCSAPVWKTNYEDIIVSKESINCTVHKNHSDFQTNFKKLSKDLCEDEKVPRTWYIYQYQTDVRVTSSSRPCEDLRLRSLPKNDSKLMEGCSKCGNDNSPYCRYCRVCTKIYEVDLEKDEVIGLPGCKYSDGICRSGLGALWQYTNRCSTVKKVYEDLENHCGREKCVKRKDDHTNLITNLTFVREGKLCGANVWYTDQHGVVASEKELGFYQANNILRGHRNSSFHLEPHLNPVEILGHEEYYIIVPLAMCALWFVFNIVVCSVYLSCKCKRQKKTPDNNSS